MATSGSFNTSARVSGSYNTYAKFSWSQTSQSVSGNYTDISWKLVGVTASAYQYIYVYNVSATVNGSTSSKSFNANMYNGTELLSGTARISHNNDGTKSFSASAGLAMYSSGSWYSGSGSWTLNTIARAASITSAPNFNDEENPTISYSNPAGNSVSTLMACISLTGSNDDIAYRSISKTGTSYTFELTEEERNILRAATTGSSRTVYFYVRTVIGSSTLYNSVGKTLSIVNANPTFSDFTYQDTNSTITAITGNNQYLVQGKSTLRAIISAANKATAKKSATMSSYAATISGLTATGAYSDSAAVNIDFSDNAFTPGSQTLAVKAVDSRGLSTSVTKDVTVLAYAAPTISATATREGNFEKETTLVVKGAYSPLTIGSTAKNTVSSVQYRYKKQSETTWSSWASMTGLSPTSSGAYTTTNKVLELDNAYAWDIEVRVTDRLETTTATLTVSVGIPTFRIGTDDFVYNREQPLMVSHVGQVIMSTTLDTAAKVEAIYGGTWETWGAGRVPVGVDPNDSDFNAPNKTGGAKTVSLTINQMPSHNHIPNDWSIVMNNNYTNTGDRIPTGSGGGASAYTNAYKNSDNYVTRSTGGGQAHNNLQPYSAIYMWLRTA